MQLNSLETFPCLSYDKEHSKCNMDVVDMAGKNGRMMEWIILYDEPLKGNELSFNPHVTW